MEKDPPSKKINKTPVNNAAPSEKSSPEKPTTRSKKKSKTASKKTKNKGKVKDIFAGIDKNNSEAFVFEDIASNKEASALITDLVKCYTYNSNLPKDELDLLNKTLQEKTINVFISILNSCIQKLFFKLINNDFYTKFICKKPVMKKNSYCQTDDCFNTPAD